MRLIVSTLALLACAAHAQTAPLVQESQPLEPRKNQKIERLHSEDNAVKIDEVRYAGQVQSITVQPKGDMPAYEIVPANPARNGDSRRGSTGGERVWNLFNF